MSKEKEVLYWECIRKGVNGRDLKRLLDLHADEQNKELPTIHDCFIKAETMNLIFNKDSVTKNIIYGFDRHQLKSFIEYVKNSNQKP